MGKGEIRVRANFTRRVPFEAWGCCTLLPYGVEAGKEYVFELADDAVVEAVVKSLEKGGAFTALGPGKSKENHGDEDAPI